MALIKCRECGREISDRAAACVHCGCPVSEDTPSGDAQQAYAAASAQHIDPANPAPARRVRRRPVINEPVDEESAAPSASPSQPQAASTVRPAAQQAPADGVIRQAVAINGSVHQITTPVSPANQAPAQALAETLIHNTVKSSADQKRIAAFKKKRTIRLILRFFWPVFFVSGILLGKKFPEIPTPVLAAIAMTVYPAVWNAVIIIASLIGTKTDKSIKRLEARGLLGKALRERESGPFTPFGDKAVLTDHFIFRKNKSADIMLACDDVVWVYTSYFRRYYSLMLGTKSMGVLTLSGAGVKMFKKDHKQVINDAIVELRRRNPAILIGNTKENKANYKTLRKK